MINNRKIKKQQMLMDFSYDRPNDVHKNGDYTLQQATLLRRMMALSNSHSDAASDPSDFTKRILREMGKTKSNEEFLKFDFLKKKNGY